MSGQRLTRQAMINRRNTIMRRSLCLAVFTILVTVCPRSLIGGDWLFRMQAKSDVPNTMEQVARSIDSIEDKVLDDGTVVIKQPDVYGQSRMTLYRKNFETQLYRAINQFNFVLSARVVRTDQAALQSQTFLLECPFEWGRHALVRARQMVGKVVRREHERHDGRRPGGGRRVSRPVARRRERSTICPSRRSRPDRSTGPRNRSDTVPRPSRGSTQIMGASDSNRRSTSIS